MDDAAKTKTELLHELRALRRRNAELETLDAERKQAEKTLAEREAELRAANTFLEHVIATSPAVIFEGDPAAGHKTTFLSPNVAWIRGYTREEILADPSFWVDHIHPDDRAHVLAGIEHALTNRVPFYTVEYRFLHKDGRYRWFYDVVHYEYDRDGAVISGIGCQLDITDRKRAVEAVQESEDRFRVLFENSPDGIFLLDPHHPDGMWRLVDCNEVACRMNGYTREELIGQPINLLDVGPAEPGGDIAFLERIRREGTVRAETLHRRKDGSIFPIEFSICFITLDGRELVLGIDRDVSERKQAEEARLALERALLETQQRAQMEAVLRQNEVLREVDRLKSEFIANVSHELRTPLHHIKGYAGLLLQRRHALDEATTQDFLQTIADAADRLARLYADLLDTSQVATGSLTLEPTPLRLDEVVRAVVQRWQGISSHRFVARVPERVPAVSADRGRIEQVLDNLLANVARHTPETTLATVEIEVRPEEMIVAVRDTGPGLEAKHLTRLFDRFYQAGALAVERRGSGLGLFICRAIIEQHGGRIWAESTAGEGTTIYFALPKRMKDEG
jgi:PAS domain S-box-containing protein